MHEAAAERHAEAADLQELHAAARARAGRARAPSAKASRRAAGRRRRAARRRAAGGARAARPCARATPRSRPAGRRGSRGAAGTPPRAASSDVCSSASRSDGAVAAPRMATSLRPGVGISRRRWRTTSATGSSGTATGSPVSSHVPSSRRTSWPSRASSAERGRDRRPARADEFADQPVREHERHRDAVARDAAPALGEMPEEREQAAVDAVELRDRLRDREPLRALGQAVDDHRADLREAAERDGRPAVDQPEPHGRQRVPADRHRQQLRRAFDVPRAHDVAGAEQLRADGVPEHDLAREHALDDQQARGAAGRRRRAGRRPTRRPGTWRRARAARAARASRRSAVEQLTRAPGRARAATVRSRPRAQGWRSCDDTSPSSYARSASDR